jgi:serine protease Do
MRKGRFALFGGLLAVAVAVSAVAAQPRPEPQTRTRPRVMMLDGRGAQIGVSVDDLNDQELKAAAGAPSGVLIEDVDQDSPASRAGLRQGDIVVDVDGERVRSARQFSRLIQETPDGRTVKLGVVRDGKRQAVDVTPEARASGFGPDSDRLARDIERGMRKIEPRLRELEPRLREFHFDAPRGFDFDFSPRMTSPRGRLGVQLNELTPQLAEYFGAKDGGVLVASVTKDSPAEKAGVKAGDVIVSIDGDRVRRSDDLVDELRDREGEISVGILRDKKESTLKATIEGDTPRPGTRRPA